MICENCLNTHDGSYATGRFCSKLCSKSFSTKAKRKEINEKISKKFKGIDNKTGLPSVSYVEHKKICVGCGTEFLTKRKEQKYHNKKCSATSTNARPDVQEKLRLARYKSMDDGSSGGMGIRSYYDDIRCDSALEYAFIKWYKQKHPNAVIKRFKGFLEGNGIKYQPDFIINDSIIVEVKHTSQKIGQTYLKKWSTYQTTQEAKIALLQSHDYMWITEKDIGKKFYLQCIDELKPKLGSA